jgi:hypothetical protein
MKKALFVLLAFTLVLFVSQPVFAAESAKITWKQATAELPYVQEWIVYSGDAANPTVELTRIPYDGSGAASYTSTIPITVTGTPGAKVRKYFSLASVSKNGTITAKVAGATATTPPVAYLEFTVPYPNVGVPFDVIISIVGTP